jgi:hypothetical protein
VGANEMNLIVYPSIEFEIDKEASVKECIAFLVSKGFDDIGNFHFHEDCIICTANYYGRGNHKFRMCLRDLSFYGEWIAHRGLDHNNLTSYNAEQLNILCKRDGHER